MQLSPNLSFNGQCEAAFKFYETCLGGKIEAMITYGETPLGKQTPAEWRSKIIHARMALGGTTLMGADTQADRFKQPQGFTVSLGVDTAGEAERIFAALADKGMVTMAMAPTFFASRLGAVVDRFGTPWEIVSRDRAPRELTLTRVLNAPRALVFKAWTDPKMLAAWWGPKGFTNPRCEADARPGGAIHIDMRAPDGTVYPMEARYEEIIAPERLVFKSGALDKNGKTMFTVLNTVTFAEAGGKTTLTLHARVVEVFDPVAERHLSGMNEGWNQSSRSPRRFCGEELMTRQDKAARSARSRFASPVRSFSIAACSRFHKGTAAARSLRPAAVSERRRPRLSALSIETFTSPRRCNGFSAAVSVVRSITNNSETSLMRGGSGRLSDMSSEN